MASLCTATNKKLVTFLFWTPTKANYVSKWSDFQKKLIDTITTSNFFLKFKENNENDMAAHAICFDFCYRPQPIRIRHWFAGPDCQACHFKTIEGLYFFCFTQFITPKLHKCNNRGQWTKRVHGWSTKSSIVWQFFSEFLLPTFWFGTPTKKKSNGTEFIALVKKQPEKRNCLELPNN